MKEDLNKLVGWIVALLINIKSIKTWQQLSISQPGKQWIISDLFHLISTHVPIRAQ